MIIKIDEDNEKIEIIEIDDAAINITLICPPVIRALLVYILGFVVTQFVLILHLVIR
jgi:hypothetical protein